MNCEQVSNVLIRYMDGRANESERREVKTHLAACEDCHARVEEYLKLWNVLDEAPVTEPSFGFDARLRARVAVEPQQKWFAWLVPPPRLAFATALLAALSIWMWRLPTERPEVMTSEKQFQMIRDLRVLENYDVLSNFEALSELPVTNQAPQQPDEQQKERDAGTL